MPVLDDSDAEYYKLSENETEELTFTNENVEHFLLYKKSVEIIGIVDKPQKLSSLIKFNLINRTGYIIQVAVYNQTLWEKVRAFLQPGNIMYLGGLFVNKKHNLSNSNIDYDLIFSSNSVIRMIKEGPNYPRAPPTGPIVIPISTIEDSVKYNCTIHIKAWLKQRIAVQSLPKKKINQGCLSDCQKYKLEIRMLFLDDMTNIEIGTHLCVTGTIEYYPHACLLIGKKEDIKVESPETKTVAQILKGSMIPKRPLGNTTTTAAVKGVPQATELMDRKIPNFADRENII